MLGPGYPLGHRKRPAGRRTRSRSGGDPAPRRVPYRQRPILRDVNTLRGASVIVLSLLVLTAGCSASGTSASPSTASSAAAATAASTDADGAPTAEATLSTAAPTSVPTAAVTPSAMSSAQASAVAAGDMTADRLEPVKAGQAEVLDNGVTVSVAGVAREDVSSSAPDDPAGAGVVVPVTVANTTDKKIELSAFVTTVAVGKDEVPAQEALSASDEVPATLAPGQAVTIRRAFVLQGSSKGALDLTILVDMGAATRSAVFTVSVPAS